MTALTTITAETLPAMTWQQARVVTTELLAKLYGTDVDNVRKNFNNNADKFIEGTHYFKLEGEPLRDFKNCVNNSHAVPKHTRNLTLWTERGAARHAKMLDTEAAWEVFERLEDCYFRVQDSMRSFTKNPGDVLSIEQADLLRNAMAAHCTRLPKPQQGAFMVKGWSKLKSHFKVGYRQIPQEQLTEALSIITRHAADWEVVDESVAVPQISREQLLTDILNHGRWTMVVRDGRITLLPVPGDAVTVTLKELPALVRDSLISTPDLSNLLMACAERLAKRNAV